MKSLHLLALKTAHHYIQRSVVMAGYCSFYQGI